MNNTEPRSAETALTPPPQQVLMQMRLGMWVAQAVATAARLGIADALAQSQPQESTTLSNWPNRGEDTKRNLKHVKDRAANVAERPQRVSSVTRIKSTVPACANARTFLRSARSCFGPGAISFQTPTILLSSLLGEGA